MEVQILPSAIVVKLNKDKFMTPVLFSIIAGVIANLLSDYITKKYQKTTPATINNIITVNYYGDVHNTYIDRVEK